ncbi:MAG: CHAT domain-containing tetratricopeptide repeat protein [Cyanobacteria bacterium P01_D01_bin.156]
MLRFKRVTTFPITLARASLIVLVSSGVGSNNILLAAVPQHSRSIFVNHLAQNSSENLFEEGLAAYKDKNFEHAAYLWQQALDQYQANHNLAGEIATLEALGAAYLKLQQYDQVVHYLQPLLAMSAEEVSWQTQAAAGSNLALALRRIGNYVDALSQQYQVLKLRQDNQDIRGEAEAALNLGQIYQLLGNYDQAVNLYQKSLELIKEVQSPQTEAIILTSIGTVYFDQGQYSQALTYYERSRAIADDIGNLKIEAYALANIGNVYLLAYEDDEAAMQSWNQALELSRQISDGWLTAKNASSLGLVYAKLSRFEKALSFHSKAQQQFQAIGSKPDIARSLNNRAHSLLEWGKVFKADGDSRQATEKFQAAASSLTEAVALLDSIRGGLSTDAQRVSVFDTQTMTYNLLQQVFIEQSENEVALQISEQGRARAFSTLIAEQQSVSEDFSLEKFKAIARNQNVTLVEYSIIPKNEVVHQGKEKGEAGELYIWVVTPTGDIKFHRENLDDISLKELIEASRISIGVNNRGGLVAANDSSVDPTQSLKDLHKILIDPIQNWLPRDKSSSDTEQVVIIPQGELFLVPFPALIDEQDSYLIEKHTLLTAPSMQTLSFSHQLYQSRDKRDFSELTEDDWLVVGNPTMPEVWSSEKTQKITLQSLPGAEQEANAIATQFGIAPFIGNEATESNIRQRLESSRVIHLATHGLLEYGNPKDSGISDTPGAIALTPDDTHDGLLTAAELSEFNLNADLVVLSACDTGLGDITGDGVIGLSRSLMQAGAPSVVVSLWAVPDAPTAKLMTDFYNQLKQGENKAQALRQAMLKTLRSHPEPRNWAAFTLVGSVQ